jgi:hypothetical protein
MAAGINPKCIGAINTDYIILGNEDGSGIVVDNTINPSQIFFNGVAMPPVIGAITIFNSTVEGLNPPRTMYIGSKNTNTIVLGSNSEIILDNTVTPAQIYMYGVAMPRLIRPSDMTLYYINLSGSGNSATLPDAITLVANVASQSIISIDSIGAGTNNIFTIVNDGSYEITNIDQIFLVAKTELSVFDNETGFYLLPDMPIKQSMAKQKCCIYALKGAKIGFGTNSTITLNTQFSITHIGT